MSVLIHLCFLVLVASAFGQFATVEMEQRNPKLRSYFYNTTIMVPIDRPADSPVTIVQPQLLSRFYLLGQTQEQASVSCTPLFDTVPATRFPTLVGPTFDSRSSTEPPSAADALSKAKLRFWCSSTPVAAPAQSRQDHTPFAEIYLEKRDPNNGTMLNESHTVTIERSGKTRLATVFSTFGVSRLFLPYVRGVDQDTVTCTPIWTIANNSHFGPAFGFGQSSARPAAHGGNLGPSFNITCVSPDAP